MLTWLLLNRKVSEELHEIVSLFKSASQTCFIMACTYIYIYIKIIKHFIFLYGIVHKKKKNETNTKFYQILQIV